MAIRIFSWQDLAMFPGPQPTVLQEDAITGVVYNLMNINQGDFLFNPELGSTLEDLLFEAIDEITAQRIRIAILNTITRWDPRIQVSNATVVEPFPDENRYEVDLVINILSDNDTTNQFLVKFDLFQPSGNN